MNECTLLPSVTTSMRVRLLTLASKRTTYQGLTLVHFSAQLEPCLTHKNTLHTLNTP